MVETIGRILIINAYWFSLPFIGYMLIKFFGSSTIAPKLIKTIATTSLRQHPLTLFVISFALTCLLCSLISIPFYIFNLPVQAFSFIYSVVLLFSILYFVVSLLRNPFKTPNLGTLWLRNTTLSTRVLFILLVLVIIADFLVAQYVKCFIAGDAIFHMSRVLDIVSNGFNIQSSFFNNIPDGGYHYNVIYALYAVPSQLLQIEPMGVWEFSLGFYRLLGWLSIFTLAMHVFGKWLKSGKMTLPLSILSTIFAVSLYADRFYLANYPSRVASFWVVLLIICLSYATGKSGKLAGFIAICISFVITMTHPRFAFMSACFILLLVVFRLIIERTKFVSDKVAHLTYIASTTVLLIGPIITKIMPVRVTSDFVNLELKPLWNIYGMTMKPPEGIFIGAGDPGVQFLVAVLGLIGCIYLLIKLRNRGLELAIAISLSFLFIIVAYIPPVFTVMNYFVPEWVISGFSLFSPLEYIFVTLGVCGLMDFALKILKTDLSIVNKSGPGIFYYSMFVIIILCLSVLTASISYKNLIGGQESVNVAYAQMSQNIGDFKGILNNQKVVVATTDFSYYLTAQFAIDIIAVPFGHSTITSDALNRRLCHSHIWRSFDYADLSAVNASYVIVVTYEEDKVRSEVESKPYLKFVKGNSNFKVYQFIKNTKYIESKDSVYKPCLLYQQNETK